jgi:hypothetical protein
MALLKDTKLYWLPKNISKIYAIDYQEIFASIVEMNTNRILLSIAINQG